MKLKNTNKHNIQVQKYLDLINCSKLICKDLDETIDYLDAINTKLLQYSMIKLKLMRTELNSLVEMFKQSSLVTSVVSTLVAISVVLLTAMKDLVLPESANDIEKSILYFTTILVCLVVFIPSLFLLSGFSKKLKILSQLLGLLDLAISIKENIRKPEQDTNVNRMRFEDGSPIT